jgi:2-keto-4-pentenoate hydratase/2-oxohepta-3-ene-1,7-dioic acid hydratase in catechol pathway
MTSRLFGRVELDGRPTLVVRDGETLHELQGSLFGDWTTGRELNPAGLRVLSPVTPANIACIGRNYRAHAEELGNEVPPEPLVFLKPASSLSGPGQPIVLPPESERVDHEAELALVIGRTARRVPTSQAAAYVLGWTAANDVTARDLQTRDGQWSRAKGFDTFCPVGPWIVEGMPPADLEVSCYVNQEGRQYGRLADLIYPLEQLVAYVSAFMTLSPGDIILTGTPAGISPLHQGDSVRVCVGSLELTNPVIRE